jgi:hypothetical protein
MVQGMAIAGTSAGAATVTATGGLIVSTSAIAAGSCTVSGLINAALFGSATAGGTSTASATVGALGWVSGQAAGSCTASLVSYATGALSGHIYVNQSEATVTQIVGSVWGALSSDYDASGTMGERLNDAGSASNPWAESLPGSYVTGQAGHILGNLISALWEYSEDGMFEQAQVVSGAGNSATSFVTDLGQAETDHWKDSFLLFRSGDLKGQVRRVTAYNGATKVVTSEAFTGIPADADRFLMVNR